MLSSLLNGKRAVQVNALTIRAFVRLRELVATHKDLARKIDELEARRDANIPAPSTHHHPRSSGQGYPEIKVPTRHLRHRLCYSAPREEVTMPAEITKCRSEEHTSE